MSYDYLQAIVLGVIQGIAEFLPISSKGHLVVFGALFERLTGRPHSDGSDNLFLIVVLHLGTLGSILVVYRADLWKVMKDYRLCALIVLATIPAAAVGLRWKDELEAAFDNPTMAACGWLVTAALLCAAQRFERGARSLEQMTTGDALLVGAFQAVALLPGVSRSGTTISGGLISGMSREASTSFSFLIAVPAIAGAVVVKVGPVAWELTSGTLQMGDALQGYQPLPLAVGAITSFVVGILSLRWLIRVVVRRGLMIFSGYLVVAAVLTLAWQAFEQMPQTAVPPAASSAGP